MANATFAASVSQFETIGRLHAMLQSTEPKHMTSN
jgi:hypothetical protein